MTTAATICWPPGIAGRAAAAAARGTLASPAVSHDYPPALLVRVKGLVAADVTQLIAFAGIFSMFFFVTLYMQEVLHYTPLRAGAAYLPITAGFAVAGSIAAREAAALHRRRKLGPS